MEPLLQRNPLPVERAKINPFPLLNMEALCDESGTIKYQANELVPKSMADDFSVTELALYGMNKIAPLRVSTDIVDLEKEFNN